MHSLYFVIVPKDAENPREEANEILINENFVGVDGYFSAGKADWFVIGGRWSGTINPKTKPFTEKAKKTILKTKDGSISMQLVEEKKDELQKLWEKMGGKDVNPLNRDTYEALGYKDDAQKITKSLFKRLKKDYSDVEVFIASYCYETTIKDLEDELEDEQVLGNYIVVIDYHF